MEVARSHATIPRSHEAGSGCPADARDAAGAFSQGSRVESISDGWPHVATILVGEGAACNKEESVHD